MQRMSKHVARAGAGLMLVALCLIGSVGAQAQAVTIEITVKNGKFEPATIEAPANRPITLKIKNLDNAAIEFESVTLRVEKVIAAKGEATITIRPLAPGRYEFFDEFHPTNRGTLVVQ